MTGAIMKRISTLFTLLILILSFILFFPQNIHAEELSGEIEVLIHVNASEMDKYKKAFEKKYPNVTVHYTTYYDYEAELQKRIESGDYGDVLYIPSFFANLPFQDYLEPFGNVDYLSEKYDFLNKGWLHNNTVYGIPSYAYITGFIYNTEVFDKAGITKRPTTTTEFLEAMDSIKKHTNAIPFYTNCSIDWALYPWTSFPYIEMTGDPSYRYNDFVFKENPFSKGTEHYEVYKLLYDLVASDYVEDDVLNCDWYETCQMLNRGEIGCIAIGSWALEQIRNVGPYGENIAFMPFPNNINGKQYVTASVDFSYGVSSRSEHKDIAQAYVAFMLEESGYATDRENISTFKADLYPKSILSLGDIEVLTEVIDYDENWNFHQTLSQDLNLNDITEFQRIIKAASGLNPESFDDIIDDWNKRWEKNRTAKMKNKKTSKPISTLWEDRSFQLSATELDFIQSTPAIKVGYLRHQAPFSMERDGQFQGASYEICAEIIQKTGLQMEFIGYNNTQELLKALAAKEIDTAACIEKQEILPKNIVYSREYITCANAFIKKGEFSSEINSEHNAAAITGERKDYWITVSQIDYYDNLASCLNAIEKGTVDYTIANFYSANYYMLENMNKNISIIPSTSSSSMHFAFHEHTNYTLVAIINKCIYNISESNVQLYVQKHMNTDNADITFKRFIEANPTLFISIITGVFFVILLLITIILVERYRNAQKSAIEMKRYEILSNLSNEYIFDYEYATDTVRFDPKFATEFSFNETVFCKDVSTHSKELSQFITQLTMLKDNQEHMTFQMHRANNTSVWYKMVGFPIKDNNGETKHIIGKLVNAQKEMEEKEIIQAKAENDALTKLYNREGFRKRTKHLATPFMLAILDLDNFKSVNDTLGHTGGDEALKLLARKLEYHMGETSILGRYGGDEFVVALPNTSREEAEKKLQALVNGMNTELIYEGIKKQLSISVGAVYCAEENIPTETLFKHADKELYCTKLAGKNGYHISTWNQD